MDVDMMGVRRKTIQSMEEDVCDLGEICDGPNQVKLAQYPQIFSWLEYSVGKDAAFCFSCRMFGKNVKHDTFVTTGLTNWKKALDLFRGHEKTPANKIKQIKQK